MHELITVKVFSFKKVKFLKKKKLNFKTFTLMTTTIYETVAICLTFYLWMKIAAL